MGILIGLCIGAVVVFAIAYVLFGPAIAVALFGVVGACFGGPPGAGAGIVLGLILVPVTAVLGVLVAPEDE
jgi:hypothetical protein